MPRGLLRRHEFQARRVRDQGALEVLLLSNPVLPKPIAVGV